MSAVLFDPNAKPHQPRTTATSWRRAAGALAGLTVLALAACSSGTNPVKAPSPQALTTVNLVTHDSFHLSDEAKAAFEKESGLTLNVVTSGDGGQLANQLVLTKDAPLGDAFFGVETSFASQLIDQGVTTPYLSPKLPASAAALAPDTAGSMTPIDYGDVCINIDTDWFNAKKLTFPATYADLLKPEYKDLTVALDPTSSSPGAAFLLGTIAAFGADGYEAYWTSLVGNGAKIATGWSDAYYTDFTAGGEGGQRPIVVSYGSSPAFTVAKDGKSSSTSALLDTCTKQVEYAGILAGAKNTAGAQKVIDFLLSEQFQNEVPEGMYMYPVLDSVKIPETWSTFAPLPTKTNDVPSADIAKNRTAWLSGWAGAVGQ